MPAHRRRLGALVAHLLPRPLPGAAQRKTQRQAAAGDAAVESGAAEALPLEAKRELYHQGFTIVRNAVPAHLLEAARQLVASTDAPEQGRVRGINGEAVIDLISQSSLRPLLTELNGAFELERWSGSPTIIPAPDEPLAAGQPLTDVSAFSCAPLLLPHTPPRPSPPA